MMSDEKNTFAREDSINEHVLDHNLCTRSQVKDPKKIKCIRNPLIRL